MEGEKTEGELLDEVFADEKKEQSLDDNIPKTKEIPAENESSAPKEEDNTKIEEFNIKIDNSTDEGSEESNKDENIPSSSVEKIEKSTENVEEVEHQEPKKEENVEEDVKIEKSTLEKPVLVTPPEDEVSSNDKINDEKKDIKIPALVTQSEDVDSSNDKINNEKDIIDKVIVDISEKVDELIGEKLISEDSESDSDSDSFLEKYDDVVDDGQNFQDENEAIERKEEISRMEKKKKQEMDVMNQRDSGGAGDLNWLIKEKEEFKFLPVENGLQSSDEKKEDENIDLGDEKLKNEKELPEKEIFNDLKEIPPKEENILQALNEIIEQTKSQEKKKLKEIPQSITELIKQTKSQEQINVTPARPQKFLKGIGESKPQILDNKVVTPDLTINFSKEKGNKLLQSLVEKEKKQQGINVTPARPQIEKKEKDDVIFTNLFKKDLDFDVKKEESLVHSFDDNLDEEEISEKNVLKTDVLDFDTLEKEISFNDDDDDEEFMKFEEDFVSDDDPKLDFPSLLDDKDLGKKKNDDSDDETIPNLVSPKEAKIEDLNADNGDETLFQKKKKKKKKNIKKVFIGKYGKKVLVDVFKKEKKIDKKISPKKKIVEEKEVTEGSDDDMPELTLVVDEKDKQEEENEGDDDELPGLLAFEEDGKIKESTTDDDNFSLSDNSDNSDLESNEKFELSDCDEYNEENTITDPSALYGGGDKKKKKKITRKPQRYFNRKKGKKKKKVTKKKKKVGSFRKKELSVEELKKKQEESDKACKELITSEKMEVSQQQGKQQAKKKGGKGRKRKKKKKKKPVVEKVEEKKNKLYNILEVDEKEKEKAKGETKGEKIIEKKEIPKKITVVENEKKYYEPGMENNQKAFKDLLNKRKQQKPPERPNVQIDKNEGYNERQNKFNQNYGNRMGNNNFSPTRNVEEDQRRNFREDNQRNRFQRKEHPQQQYRSQNQEDNQRSRFQRKEHPQQQYRPQDRKPNHPPNPNVYQKEIPKDNTYVTPNYQQNKSKYNSGFVSYYDQQHSVIGGLVRRIEKNERVIEDYRYRLGEYYSMFEGTKGKITGLNGRMDSLETKGENKQLKTNLAINGSEEKMRIEFGKIVQELKDEHKEMRKEIKSLIEENKELKMENIKINNNYQRVHEFMVKSKKKMEDLEFDEQTTFKLKKQMEIMDSSKQKKAPKSDQRNVIKKKGKISFNKPQNYTENFDDDDEFDNKNAKVLDVYIEKEKSETKKKKTISFKFDDENSDDEEFYADASPTPQESPKSKNQPLLKSSFAAESPKSKNLSHLKSRYGKKRKTKDIPKDVEDNEDFFVDSTPSTKNYAESSVNRVESNEYSKTQKVKEIEMTEENAPSYHQVHRDRRPDPIVPRYRQRDNRRELKRIDNVGRNGDFFYKEYYNRSPDHHRKVDTRNRRVETNSFRTGRYQREKSSDTFSYDEERTDAKYGDDYRDIKSYVPYEKKSTGKSLNPFGIKKGEFVREPKKFSYRQDDYSLLKRNRRYEDDYY